LSVGCLLINNFSLSLKKYRFYVHLFSCDFDIEPTAEDNNGSDEVSDKEGTNESEVDNQKEEETTPAVEVTSEQPRGIGSNLSFFT
jgi:hypothetical protein